MKRKKDLMTVIYILFLLLMIFTPYLLYFRIQESMGRVLRGEHLVGSESSFIKKYEQKSRKEKMIQVSGSFISTDGKITSAFFPAKSIHSLIIGSSGYGKSTLIEALAQARLQLPGNNIIIIEPHLSLSRKVVSWATFYGKQVTFVDLALTDGMIVSWDPLRPEKSMSAEDAASFLLGCFDDRFNVFSTVQQAECLRATFVLLAENGLTLDYFQKVIYDDDFRKTLLTKSRSNHAIDYFKRYQKLSPSQQESRVQPAINKVSLLLQDRASRLLLTQDSHRSLSLDEIINNPEAVLIVCLNRGSNPTVADLIGSLLLSAIKNAVFRRPPESNSVPTTHIFCDEFPAFLPGDSVGSNLLAEARKYKISLNLIAQFINQTPSLRFRKELEQNTSMQYLFNLDSEEAKHFDRKLFDPTEKKSLSKLPPYQCYILDKGIQDKVLFRTSPLTCPDIRPTYVNARPVEDVEKELEERKIRDQSGDKSEAPPTQSINQESEHEKFRRKYGRKGKRS